MHKNLHGLYDTQLCKLTDFSASMFKLIIIVKICWTFKHQIFTPLSFKVSIKAIQHDTVKMWPGLRKQGIWAQTTPCLSYKSYLSIGIEHFCSVSYIIIPNKFVLSAENFIAIVCWDKKLWVQKDGKSRQKSCALFSQAQSQMWTLTFTRKYPK